MQVAPLRFCKISKKFARFLFLKYNTPFQRHNLVEYGLILQQSFCRFVFFSTDFKITHTLNQIYDAERLTHVIFKKEKTAVSREMLKFFFLFLKIVIHQLQGTKTECTTFLSRLGNSITDGLKMKPKPNAAHIILKSIVLNSIIYIIMVTSVVRFPQAQQQVRQRLGQLKRPRGLTF